MTDERWDLVRASDHWTPEQETALLNETERARASEDEKALENARLMNECVEMEKTIKSLARGLACEVADPENPGHITSCPTSDDKLARCSKKCVDLGALLTRAGDGL